METSPNHSAFPQGTNETQGLTKFEHFANHAPLPIPEWFKTEFSIEPPIVPPFLKYSPFMANHPNKLLIERYADTDGETDDDIWGYAVDMKVKIPNELKVEVREYLDNRKAQVKALEVWSNQVHVQRYFKWRIYYAEQLINHLNHEHNK